MNGHPPPDLAPEEIARPPLARRQTPPAEAIDPANRLEVEGREHVEKVLVRDLVTAMKPIDAFQRLAAALTVVAPL